MAILQHGAFGASFYNLPNTLVGMYESPVISVKATCNTFQFRCHITPPSDNILFVGDYPEGLTFCGMITPKPTEEESDDFVRGFSEFKLECEGSTEPSSSYSIFQIRDNEDGERHEVKITDRINIDEYGRFAYTPCSFIVEFRFIVNGEIQIRQRAFNEFEFDPATQKYQLINPIDLTDLKHFPSSMSYKVKFMTNDDEKSFFVSDIEVIGDLANMLDDGELNECEGYLIYNVGRELKNNDIDPNTITHIRYSGSQTLHSGIEVRSKIYKARESDDVQPSMAEARWSDPYFINNNKLALKDGVLKSEKVNEQDENVADPVLITYDPAEYFSLSADNPAVDYEIKTKAKYLILHGGAALRSPTFIADKKRYYSGLLGDVDADGSVGSEDISIMPPIGVKLGDHNYVEAKDLIADDMITSLDYDIIYANLNQTTKLGGGYICVKVEYAPNDGSNNTVLGQHYVYEEGDYKIDLDSFDISDGKLLIEVYLNRAKAEYISPYISLLSVVTENEYSSKIEFGPNSVYQSIISADMVEGNDKRVKSPTFLYYSLSEHNDIQCEEKFLTINNLPFTLPYWFSFQDTPLDAQDIFSLTVNGDFAIKNPHVKLYLEINLVGAQEIYTGGNINREVSNGLALLGGEVVENASNEKRTLIDANTEIMVAEFICLFEADQKIFEVAGKCWSDKKDDPSYLDLSLELMQEYLLKDKDYAIEVEVIGPKTSDGTQNLVQMVVRRGDTWEEVDSVRLDHASNDIYYYQKFDSKHNQRFISKKHYSGVLNPGDVRGAYKRTIFAHEIPCLNPENLSVTCSNVIQAQSEMRSRLYFEANDQIKDLIKVEFLFDRRTLEKLIAFDLVAVVVSIDDTPTQEERAQAVVSLASKQMTMNLQEESFRKINFNELSSMLGSTITQDTVLYLENLSDNTQLIFTYDKDGIVIEGKGLYDFREDWIPKIKNGYFFLDGSEQLYHTSMTEVRLTPIQNQINNAQAVNGVFGRAAFFNKSSDNLLLVGKTTNSSRDFDYAILETDQV